MCRLLAVSSSSDEEASWLAVGFKPAPCLSDVPSTEKQTSKQAGTTTKLDGGAASSLSSANKDNA